MTLSTSPIAIPSSPRTSTDVQSALSDAISTPVSSISASGHINAIAGPSRPSASRRSTPSRSPPSARKDWSPMTPASGSGAAVVAVAGKVGNGEQSEVDKRGKGVERGLSDLIIRSDRSPDKKPPLVSRSTSKATTGTERTDASGSSAAPAGKKGWGLSLVGGAVNAGVYGAALGVTAYKLWKQSSSQTFEPSIPASASAPAALGGPSSPSRDGSILPSIPAVGEIAPPPAYRERDHADNVDWADELDDEDLVTPSTSRTPTVRSPGHQHPLLHNTPSRSWGKKRRTRVHSGGLAKRSSLTYGEITPPITLPSPPSPEVDSDPGGVEPAIGEEAVAIVVEGQEDILDRLDGMTLRIQKLILEGQAALIRRPEDVGRGHMRASGSGSWGRRGGRGSSVTLRVREGGKGSGQDKVLRSRRSLPVVGVTMGE